MVKIDEARSRTYMARKRQERIAEEEKLSITLEKYISNEILKTADHGKYSLYISKDTLLCVETSNQTQVKIRDLSHSLQKMLDKFKSSGYYVSELKSDIRISWQ